MLRVFLNPSLWTTSHPKLFVLLAFEIHFLSSSFGVISVFRTWCCWPRNVCTFFRRKLFSALLLLLTCCGRNYRQETFLTSLLYTSTFCRQKCPGAVETNVATLLSPFFAPPQSKVLDHSLGNNPTALLLLLLHPDGRFIVLLLHVLAITSLVSATIYSTKRRSSTVKTG